MDEEGPGGHDDKAPLTLEQWKAKLEEKKAEYTRNREVVRLRAVIGKSMTELATLIPDKDAESMLKRHHPNQKENLLDYGSEFLSLVMEPGKKSGSAENEWFEEANRVLTSEELAAILYPGELEKSRERILQLIRNKRSRVKGIVKEELRWEFEMNDSIEKERAKICKREAGICEGCPRQSPEEDDFQCGMKYLIASDPDKYSDC